MVKMNREDINGLAKIMAEQAFLNFSDPHAFFKDLLEQSDLPDRWKYEVVSFLNGNPDSVSRELINWAQAKGINDNDHRYTALGSILQLLLEKVGPDIGQKIAAYIVVYRLYVDNSQLNNLVARYQIPLVPEKSGTPVSDYGPEINWNGPTEQIELQGRQRSEPEWADVGFLTRAIAQAAAVCRVEIPEGRPEGTGFLITRDLLLTNYHVLAPNSDADIQQRARDTVLRFGNITAADGSEEKGQIFKLAVDTPVLRSSIPGKLDYALVRVDGVRGVKEIHPVVYSLEMPYKGMALNVLQHAEGKPLKLAWSGDGVDNVISDKGLVQYSTKTESGSSGSPCFTDKWEVIALHHAQASRWFGVIREGIIFKSIYEEIKGDLAQS